MVVDPNNSHAYGRFAVYVRTSQASHVTATWDDSSSWHISFIP